MARSFWEICGLRRPVEEQVEDVSVPMDTLVGMMTEPVKQKPFVADFRRQGILSGREALDVYSPTWAFVKSTIGKRIEELRKKNDTTTLSETKTNVIRGRIAELKDLLKLPDDDKK